MRSPSTREVETPTPTPLETPVPTPSNESVAKTLETNKESLKTIKIPQDPREIVLTTVTFYACAKLAADARERNDSALNKAAMGLEKELARTQASMFPKLRKAWAVSMNKKMWEHDVSVRSLGDGARTIEFVAAIFASNGPIKSTQETMQETLAALRFKKVQYRWFKNAEDYTYYKLDTPRDDTIATAP